MKFSIFLAAMVLAAAAPINAQTQVAEFSGDALESAKAPVKMPPDRYAKELPATKNETAGADQTQPSYVRPDAGKRFKRYANDTFGPVSLATDAASAGIFTWANKPAEWGDKWEGFGRRFASNVGKTIIKGTTTYFLDEALKVDSHFYRSQKRDTGSKLKNAILSTFTARNKSGKRVFGLPRIAGAYTANIVAAEVWYPGSYDYKDGLASGTISLGVTTFVNIFKEFVWKK